MADARRAGWPVTMIRSTLAIAALLAATASGLFFYLNARELEITQPFVGSDALVFGTILMFAVLILTGLVWSWVLAGICSAAALYFVFGGLLPDALAPIAQQPLNVVISYLAGIKGAPRGVLSYMPLSADMIFLLLVYGGLLHGCKVIDMFGEIGCAIGNLLRGGVAFSAVVASLLIGTVTGQAVSNIALSGCMTIPTMSRSGFSREQAGGIEVMASTGSQLLPPIMGLGAFLMAEILGVSYIEIVIAALIPACCTSRRSALELSRSLAPLKTSPMSSPTLTGRRSMRSRPRSWHLSSSSWAC